MNPSARLRTRPRSASDSVWNGRPSTMTCPPEGASSPPSRCSNVLLPDPEAPTIAMRSPCSTSRSTPISTGTSSGPPEYVLRKPRQASTGTRSFIAQRRRRIDACGFPRRVDRREERERQRDRGDRDHIRPLEVRGQLADVIHRLVEELHVE